MTKVYAVVILWIIQNYVGGISQPCARRDTANGIVCVCNATYCDTIERVPKINKNEYVVFTSSKEGLRFSKSNGQFSEISKSSAIFILFGLSSLQSSCTFTLNVTAKYQKLMGFGGAFTDSAGINILSLGKQSQEHLLRSYFSVDGIEYNLGRLPVAGTDFSTHPYSYDDGPADPQLKNFSLAKEDLKYKIPLIQRAMEMSERDINLVAACWSPPPWMKSNNEYSGFAYLKEEYYQSYSDYFIKFLEEYNKHNVKVWALSTGNEPSNGVLPVKRFNSLGWGPVTVANWTVNYLGPKIRSSVYNETLLLGFDDQRLFLPWWINMMVEADKNVLKYLDGFAIHWYWDFLIGDGVIKDIHEKYPEKFILYTEASQGDKPWERKIDFGSWERGVAYIADIIQNINVWVTGWMDWNLALDMTGGPNWAKNNVDSPILVNSSADEFYKQPMFYALGHVSKFIERDALRIDISPTECENIKTTAVQNPDGRIVIVMLNDGSGQAELSINVPDKGWINMEVPPKSFTTILC